MTHDQNKSIDVAVTVRDGKVALHWFEATNVIVFDPQNCFELAEAMARAAHQARFGEPLESDRGYLAQQIKARVTDELRDGMVTRVALMLRGLRDQDRSDGYIAMQIVDQVLKGAL